MSCNCNCHSRYGSQIDNPCAVSESNTAACESTPSVVENFIRHFFGSVEKHEVDGKVVWVLPCNLDTGLPENPRLPGEGLACYFKRLFEEGLVGLEGPQGPPGADGKNGLPAYTITLTAYQQPSLSSPYFSVRLAPHPSYVSGTTVYIQGTGWCRIETVGAENLCFLTLLYPAYDVVPGTVMPGKNVLICGPVGPRGDKGDKGDKGDAGEPGGTFTAESNRVEAVGAEHFALPTTWSQVTFSSVNPQILLPNVGTYLLIARARLIKIGAGSSGDYAELKLRNHTSTLDVPGSLIYLGFASANSVHSVTSTALVTTLVPNNLIQLWGRASASGLYQVDRNECDLKYIRLQ